MFKDFLLFIKYPYTAGIIAVIWIGSAAFLALAEINLIVVVVTDLMATLIMAFFGFGDKKTF